MMRIEREYGRRSSVICTGSRAPKANAGCMTCSSGLLRKETADMKRDADPGLIEAMQSYAALAEDGVRALLHRRLALFVTRAGSSGGAREAAALLEPLRKRPETFRAVFRELYGLSPRTAEDCFSYELGRAESGRKLQETLAFWLAHAYPLPVRFLAGETLSAVKRLLEKETLRRRIETASGLFGYFHRLPDEEGMERYGDYSELIKLEIQLVLLEGMNPGELGAEDVLQLGFMLNPPPPELLPHLSKSHRMTLDLLQSVHQVLTLKRGGEEDAAAAMAKLGPLELSRALEIIRGAWKEGLPASAFSAVTFGFFRDGSGSSGGAVPWGQFDYDRLLDYLAAHPAGKEAVYEFIVWSASDERFTGPRGIDPHYRAALSRFFDRHAPRAFRNKPVRRRLLTVPNAAFVALFREVRLRQAPLWVKLAIRKPQYAAAGLLLLVLLVLFWKPVVGAMVGPVPVLKVSELPDKTRAGSVTLTAQASDSYDGSPDIYVNGELAGKGSVSKEIALAAGENMIVVKARNKYGKISEPVTKKVVLEPPIGPQLPASSSSSGTGASSKSEVKTEAASAKSGGSGTVRKESGGR
ncbi:cadherin-like beta sandwich domain-containing protein [Paenibacillus sp. P25]|nr:cadherin-like beta sandwich domain-containing protein [Paenibacillus sp. P25]